MAGRLGQPDVAGDDGCVDLPGQIGLHVDHHLLRQVVARVEHGEDHALERQIAVEAAADELDGAQQGPEPFQRVVLALQRNQHAVRRHESVEREQPQRRRAVDEHEVVVAAHRLQRAPQPGLAIAGGDQFQLHAHQVGVRRK